MNADYYDDAETTATAPPEEAAEAPETEQPEEEGQEEEQDETPGRKATLPREFFGPEAPQPGDTAEVTVVRVHDQGVEVEFCESESGDEEAEEEPEEAPTPAAPPDENYE